jgi:hypothetical protein
MKSEYVVPKAYYSDIPLFVATLLFWQGLAFIAADSSQVCASIGC